MDTCGLPGAKLPVMDSGQRWKRLRLHVEAPIALTVLSREGRRKEGAQVP